MVDYDLVVEGFQLSLMVYGLVQLVKLRYKLDGWRVVYLAFGVAFVLYSLARLLPYLPAPIDIVAGILFGGLGYGLVAVGIYGIVKPISTGGQGLRVSSDE